MSDYIARSYCPQGNAVCHTGELKITAHREVKSDLDCADCLCRVCARNTVNDSVNPTVAYKECGCDECCVGNIVVETTEDCGKFAPDCDSCDVKDCDETVCYRAGIV